MWCKKGIIWCSDSLQISNWVKSVWRLLIFHGLRKIDTRPTRTYRRTVMYNTHTHKHTQFFKLFKELIIWYTSCDSSAHSVNVMCDNLCKPWFNAFFVKFVLICYQLLSSIVFSKVQACNFTKSALRRVFPPRNLLKVSENTLGRQFLRVYVTKSDRKLQERFFSCQQRQCFFTLSMSFQLLP